jgi:hypothetical protein
VLLLAPLMISRMNAIPFDFLTLFTLWDIAKITFAGLVAFILVGIIPVIGSFNSIPLFAQSATILGTVMLLASNGGAIVWPGVLSSLGLALVGGIVSILVFYALMMPIVALLQKRDEELSLLVSQPLGLVPALIPACFYAGWLRQANGF